MMRAKETWQGLRSCPAALFVAAALAVSVAAQDGASFNPKAKEYRAPVNSLAGAPDNPARTRAIGLLMSGEVSEAIAALTELAKGGDVPSALFPAMFYREKSRIPFPVDPAKALHLYALASREGSGEASERIAEMVEKQEIAVPAEGNAEYWRALSVKQGWQEQSLATYCYDWRHGPERLHCDSKPIANAKAAEALRVCPTDEEMVRMQEQGLTGAISQDSGEMPLTPGPHATAILLFDHAVPSEETLQEPYAGSVIYAQTPTDHWRMLPRDAPLLNRFLILVPRGAGGGRMSLSVQDVNGAATGGACGLFTN